MNNKIQLVPRDYQVEAVNKICDALKDDHSRTTVVMACGTGKTLVALWCIERLNVKRIIIFMPSLALIKQTMESWAQSTKIKQFAFMAFCSDKNLIDEDNEIFKDKSINISTTQEELCTFSINNHYATQIVFSTYQSSNNIPADISFDFGIYDEAHKTALKEEAAFRYSLKDDNVHINKRLFMTATLRNYKYANHRCNCIEYSMDNKDLYGDISYTLNFADAIKKNIICDYKILISVVTDLDITREIDKYRYLNDKNIRANVEMLSNAIVLSQALNNYPIKKALVFHQTIKDSKSFTTLYNSLYGTNIKTFHIDGTMNSQQRHNIIDEFLNEKIAILSNSRCFTEGVDIPSIDLVAFMVPKRSKIDIIQCSGRAMRKYNGKENGYILIPMYAENAYNLEQHEYNKYSCIYNIVNSLRLYDNNLQTELNSLGHDQEIYSREHSKDKIHLISESLTQEKLHNAIRVELAQRLEDEWLCNFHKAHEHYKKTGSFSFENARNLTGDDKIVYAWIRNQRYERKKNILPQDRIDLLDSIGFVWDANEDLWINNFNKLKEDYKKIGFKALTGNPGKTASWFQNQRRSIVLGISSPTKINLLTEFCNDIPGGIEYLHAYKSLDAFFSENFAKLQTYYLEHGHCAIKEKEDPILYKWANKQSHAKHKLNDNKIKLLDSINFKWRD